MQPARYWQHHYNVTNLTTTERTILASFSWSSMVEIRPLGDAVSKLQCVYWLSDLITMFHVHGPLNGRAWRHCPSSVMCKVQLLASVPLWTLFHIVSDIHFVKSSLQFVRNDVIYKFSARWLCRSFINAKKGHYRIYIGDPLFWIFASGNA